MLTDKLTDMRMSTRLQCALVSMRVPPATPSFDRVLLYHIYIDNLIFYSSIMKTKSVLMKSKKKKERVGALYASISTLSLPTLMYYPILSFQYFTKRTFQENN